MERLLEHKAASALLVAVVAALAATLLVPTDVDSLIAGALKARGPLAPPALEHFVERREMALIVEAATAGAKFVIVDGGNSAGKSVAVDAAASRLSLGRPVLSTLCEPFDTAVADLRRLLSLDGAASSTFAQVLGAVAKLAPRRPHTVAEVRRVLLARSGGQAEPVFVVEMAERLEVAELKALLDVAKELADKRRGRFVFVFSPSDKLDAIRSFGSLSRAEVVHVGDLSEAEAQQFLAKMGCALDQASALFSLIGGHLPHLAMRASRLFCGGKASISDVESELIADMDDQVEAVDRSLGVGSACGGLCGVMAKAWPAPGVLGALIREHLVVAALKKGVYVDSLAARAFVALRCACSGATSLLVRRG
jgi:hypothetical protein